MATLYPGALDTNDSLYVAVNGMFALLQGQVDSNAVTLLLPVPTGAPATGVVTIKGEAIKYTSKTATSLTGCIRGYDGTAKAPHYVNDEVDFGPIADHHNALVGAVQAIESKLGTGATMTGANITDRTLRFQKLLLEDTISKVRSSQPAFAAVNIAVAGTWYNLGNPVTITPVLRSMLMVSGHCSGAVSGVAAPGTSVKIRVLFGAANGDAGVDGIYSRDDTLGRRSVPVWDTFTQAAQGAVAIQIQVTADNICTWNPSGAGNGLQFLALAYPV